MNMTYHRRCRACDITERRCCTSSSESISCTAVLNWVQINSWSGSTCSPASSPSGSCSPLGTTRSSCTDPANVTIHNCTYAGVALPQ
jgi:hypothetical protein